jgi:phosphoglycolate phosphatase-like HAD superfamily hydrolase
MIKKEMATVKIFAGIEETLAELQRRGTKMGILSSNSKKNLDLFLREHQIEHYFDYVVSCRVFWAKGKFVGKILKKRRLGSKDLVYIGDEVGDINACHDNGVKMIGVGWGWNSKKALERAGVDWVAERPKDILLDRA